MDSLEAEQARGITMKSSAVSLVHEKGCRKERLYNSTKNNLLTHI